MTATAVIGLQWGDEAKGKIVDLLTEDHDVVVRYLGGNNAGHTVMFGGETYKLSSLPAGVLHPDKQAVITGGAVLSPPALLEEYDSIQSRIGDIGDRFLISDRAHLIFPWHSREEAVLEKARKDKAIGTTMRGIGPCYRDKAGRTHAIRMGDLVRPERFRRRLNEVAEQKNAILTALGCEEPPLDPDALYDEYQKYAERLRPHVADTTVFLHQAIKDGKRLLFEGAQGSLLDVDHGTFPYVTSSNSSGCGIHAGSGVPERVIDNMIGVVKAYSTRVGGGPFPTELEDETGQRIRDTGNEYGTVTGRPRRCGWLDGVATRYGAMVSGVDSLVVALLDVLTGLETLCICEAYEINGERTVNFPSQVDDLADAKPVYRSLPGWTEDISGVKSFNELPTAARNYLDALEELVEVPIKIVSVGPDREQTIFKG